MTQGVHSVSKENLAGVVVLYHPDADLIENIHSYVSDISKLYIVDNSEEVNEALLTKLFATLESYEYFGLKENKGIAYALNVAAEKACNEGFHWLLTMDQDSKASDQMISNLAKVSRSLPLHEIGILAPQYASDAERKTKQIDNIEDVDVAITSGNIVNLDAYRAVGPFRNDLFIDYVDHEFCLRLRLKGFRIVIVNDIRLIHKLGNSKWYRVLGREIGASHHNYIRRYYITRNRLTVLSKFKKQFPEYYKGENQLNFSDFAKIILFEKDKFKKVKSFFWGYIDFYRSRFGRFNH